MIASAHPVLYEDGRSLDWPQASYHVEVLVTSRSATVEQSLSGSPVLSELIDRGEAKWAVELRCPKTLYAKMTYHDSSICKVEWDERVVDGDIFVLPGLVSVEPLTLPTDGLNDIWGGDPIDIATGSWLVRGDVRSANSLASSLLTFHIRKELERGAMQVRYDVSSGDIHFNVYVSEAMYETCRVDRNVQMAALIAALAQLPQMARQDPEAEEGSIQYSSLQKLHDLLSDSDVPTWLDDNFDAAAAATAIESFKIREVGEEDD